MAFGAKNDNYLTLTGSFRPLTTGTPGQVHDFDGILLLWWLLEPVQDLSEADNGNTSQRLAGLARELLFLTKVDYENAGI